MLSVHLIPLLHCFPHPSFLLKFREKAEELERTKLGLGKRPDSDEEDIVDGDPFKALDINELKKKVPYSFFVRFVCSQKEQNGKEMYMLMPVKQKGLLVV